MTRCGFEPRALRPEPAERVHDRRVLALEQADRADRRLGGDHLHLVVEDLPLGGEDLDLEGRAGHYFLAASTTSSIEPLSRNADSGRSSWSPLRISRNERTVSAIGTKPKQRGTLRALGLGRIGENREAAAQRLAKDVAQRSTQARAVSARRQQLVEAVEGAAWLQARRNGRASSVEVIDALSSRIPDGAYLEKLAIEGQQLTLIGLSNQAAALVGRLEGAGAWEAPALAGALQQDPRTRMDRFTLVAKLRGAAEPEAGRGAR